MLANQYGSPTRWCAGDGSPELTAEPHDPDRGTPVERSATIPAGDLAPSLEGPPRLRQDVPVAAFAESRLGPGSPCCAKCAASAARWLAAGGTVTAG